MMKASTASASAKSPSGKVHETRKFRLRALSTEFEIYAKYFKSSVAKRISWAQIIVAVIITVAQISTMGLLREKTANEYLGIGIISSILAGFAASTTLFAAHKPTYCKLHTSMALSIIALIGHIWFLMIALGVGIPRLSKRLNYTILQNKENAKYEQELKAQNYTDMDPYGRNYYEHFRIPYTYNAELEPVGLILTNLFLTSVMSFGGVLQIVMSLTTTVMTARAMCSGRSNLEGRCFEMETIAGGNVINFRPVGASVSKIRAEPEPPKKPVIYEEKDESLVDVTLTSPPSYESANFFPEQNPENKV